MREKAQRLLGPMTLVTMALTIWLGIWVTPPDRVQDCCPTARNRFAASAGPQPISGSTHKTCVAVDCKNRRVSASRLAG